MDQLTERQKRILREMQEREDMEAAREWRHEELQAKHGEVRQ